MPTTILLLALAGAGSISWTKDYTRALTEAEERRLPLLILFRGATCGIVNAPRTADEGPRPDGYRTEKTDCDLMQEDVFENPEVLALSRRFVPVLIGQGDETLNTRYQVIVNPTTLIADPWGNEVFRVVGYLPRDKFIRVLQAVPADFARLTPLGRALRADPRDFRALMGAAGFYEQAGLRQVSERLYELALLAPAAADDIDLRREAAIARGLNLILMRRTADAVKVFEKILAEAPRGPQSDALLLGVVNAQLTAGKRREAEAAYARMRRDFPDSPYTRRARENIDGAVPSGRPRD
jgi:tetratricopeptide (TPR) repeat protein